MRPPCGIILLCVTFVHGVTLLSLLLLQRGCVKEYLITADIAKRRDFFGIMVWRDVAGFVNGNEVLQSPDRVSHQYHIVLIEKYQNLEYEAMARRIAEIINHIDLRNNCDLVVDGTGVGEAAVEQIRKLGLYPIPIIFTGGEQEREVYQDFSAVFGKDAFGAKVIKEIHVPKKNLVSAGALMLQQGRVAVAQSRWSADFRAQLAGFKGRVNEKTGHTKYEAETEELHDDLVVCYLLGAWWYLRRKQAGIIEERALSVAGDCYEHNPLEDCG